MSCPICGESRDCNCDQTARELRYVSNELEETNEKLDRLISLLSECKFTVDGSLMVKIEKKEE